MDQPYLGRVEGVEKKTIVHDADQRCDQAYATDEAHFPLLKYGRCERVLLFLSVSQGVIEL